MQAASGVDCVLLVDEFDAVGKRRDDSSDIGELKRIVNVMLLELDRWPAGQLLIAATNHAHLLDTAAVRRFEMSIEIALPSLNTRLAHLEHLLCSVPCEVWALELVAEASTGLSPSEIERLVRTARREALFDGIPLERALIAHATASPLGEFDRDIAISELSKRWRMSNRAIARLFGVTHPTVAAAVRRVEGRNRK